ncbi:MAG: response regulator [Bacteroidetes bacterium]|nr:response regulator [Bacteroidota bacterium]MCL5035308.1 response regulator [Bacteroidota bacterium]
MAKAVMVVDDSESIRKFLVFALRSQGISVVAARDGMDALEKLSLNRVDLIITDLNMPNMDGYEFLKALREDREYSEVPVIILSSLSGDQDIEAGLRLGANSYLVKPFDQKRIQYEVAKYIN